MKGDFRNFTENSTVLGLSRLFEKKGKALYVVGGSVRDALTGKIHDDFDFATNAEPNEVIGMVKRWADGLWLVGIKYGTVGLVKDNTKIEITSLRSESYPDSHRKPSVEFRNDIVEDLSRRDFTINAMAVKLPGGELLDPFDGRGALDNKVLKTPLEPDESFSDDPLRMLRAIRFVATLNLTVDTELREAMKSNGGLLKVVSKERIRDELSKTVTGEHVIDGLRLMLETDLQREVVPELSGLKVDQDPNYHHKDVLEHTFMVVERTPSDLALRLAALLHDIGKPECKRVLDDRIVFYDHNNAGARIARRRLRQLKYPKQIVEDVSKLIMMHMRAYNYRMGWTDRGVRKYVRDAGELLPKLNALIKADCTSMNPKKVKKSLESLEELEERIVRLEAEEESAKIRPPLDGNEVMDFLGIGPGPEVGKALHLLLEAKLEGSISTKEEASELLKRWAGETASS